MATKRLSRTSILTAFAACLTAVAADTEAVSVTFGPDFLGYDGAWSPAQIRVGTPEQYLLVFPSTISSETWVAGASLCDGTSTCASLRGGLFYPDNSTTWNSVGSYELGFSALSQRNDNGDYGFDNISISDTISTASQVIAIVEDIDHWIGHLGLVVEQSRFNTTTNHSSFLSTLVQNNSIIPSHSYGYTAGAAYKGRGVPGSLTLGGVDTTRFSSYNFWFTLGEGYIPSVAVRSVEVKAIYPPRSWAVNPLPVMSQNDAAFFTIDSDTPYLWLPENVCDNIANALNLTWDPTIELYTFNNNTTPDDLNTWNLEFTFRLANDLSSSEMIALPISYGAFNLQLSYPFPGLFTGYNESKINYFPLRRANSTQQFTIGRAFLQETYLVVDYERNSFALTGALYPDSSTQPVLNKINRPDDSTWPGPGGVIPSPGLSTGAKAGIAVGVVVVVCLVAALLWYFCVKKRKDRGRFDDEKSQKSGLLSVFSKKSTRNSSSSTPTAELQADKRHPTELISDASNSRYELSATAPVEMAAADVAPTFFQERTNAHIPQRNDPRSPVELVQPQPRSSTSKEEFNATHRNRTSSPVPEYSANDINQRNSSSISPYSPRRGSNPFNQHGSDNGVSPVTGSNSDRDRLSPYNHARTGSDSSRLLSPVSPIQGRYDAQSSSHSSTESSNTRQAASLNATLSPPAVRGGPRRTPSRDSRFREELTERGDNPTSESQLSRSEEATTSGRPAGQSRYSWDE